MSAAGSWRRPDPPAGVAAPPHRGAAQARQAAMRVPWRVHPTSA